MGRPYAAELEKLPETYAWSLQASVTAFADHIQSSAKLPLLTIGSGGSFTAASFSTYLHQVCTGQIAKALTPLEVVYTPLDLRDMHLLFLTKSLR